MAHIEFSRGIIEDVVPDVRLTRAKQGGDSATATFIFQNPKALSNDNTQEITGMYLIDDEGEIVTREVKGRFVNGKPEALEAVYVMRSKDEWERFLRFMQRYAEENGLEFSKS